MLDRTKRTLAAGAIAALLVAFLGTGQVAARTGISMTFSVSPTVALPGQTATWRMVLTPSGTSYTNLGIDWAPWWPPALQFETCTPGCTLDSRTGHVDWANLTIKVRTTVTLTTRVTGSGGGGGLGDVAVATAMISTPVTCLAGCGGTLTVYTSKPAAKVTMRLAPTSARPRLQTVGCGLPDCHYVDFTATFSYTSLSNDSCAFATPVTWDGRVISTISLRANGTGGCSGSTSTGQEGADLAPGGHRVCAGTTSEAGIFPDVGCATFTVLGSPTPRPTVRPTAAPTATDSPSASPSAQPSLTSSPTPLTLALVTATPTPAPAPPTNPDATPQPTGLQTGGAAILDFTPLVLGGVIFLVLSIGFAIAIVRRAPTLPPPRR